MKIIYKILPIVLCLAAFTMKAQDPVAYYPFTASAEDVSGFENHALINGALLTQDRFGMANNAFSFDGKTNFVSAPNAAHLNTDFASVSFWIYVNEIPPTGEVYLVSFGGWQERYKISYNLDGNVIWTTNSDGISDMDQGEGNKIEVGAWTHLAFVHDGTSDFIYIDGTLAAEKAVPGNLNSTEKPIGIGYNIFDGGGYFNGSLDEVQIYDVGLTAMQVAELYAAQSVGPTFDPGIIADYSFTGNLLDDSPFANHAKGTDVKVSTNRFGIGASAYTFDGISSGVTAENSAYMNSDHTTVSFWVKVNKLPLTGEVYLASFGGWQERWKISLPTHGRPVFTTNTDTGGCCSDMDSGEGNELVPGTWTHVVMVHDGAKNKIFMDGGLVNEKDLVGLLNSTEHPFGIGYDPIGMANYFDGSLDDVMVFNYGLTDQEVAMLHMVQSTLPYVPTELVADYKFTGDATDATQYANHAVNNGAETTQDRFDYGGNAFRFSGAEGITADNSILYNSDHATISFWVNVGELPLQGEVYIVSFGGWQERFKISLPSHGRPVFTTNTDIGGCCSDMDSGEGNELQIGVWTHVAMVHDGTKDKIFVNGALANEKDVAGNLNPTGHPFGIAHDPISPANMDLYFKGSLDEIQLYNVGMTDQEVADLYAAQSTPPVFSETLVADYQFGGDALDATPFRNHGWVNGALLSTDRFGRKNHSFDFDGIGAGITADNSTQLNSPTTTISFWVNVTELPLQGEVYPLSFGGWQERWKISLPAHGRPVFTTNTDIGGCCSDMDSGEGNELQIGVWTHVAMVHDGTKDKIFMNGALANDKDVEGNLNSTTNPLGIGFDPIDVANYFNGKLDDVQIYNFGMTDLEVAELFALQSQAPAITDSVAPTAPINLAGIVTNTNIDLSWWESTDDVGVAGYNVYQDSALIMNTTGAAAAITGLAQLTDFTFGVAALDAAGNASRMSTIQLTTGEDATPDTIPPTTVMNLKASTSPNSVILSWDPATDNRAVGGYVVFIDGEFLDSLDADATSIFVGGLEPETPYYFEVQTYDLAGNVSEFAEIEATTAPPVVTAEEGLVAHYPFEGDANDITPFENHGEIGGDVFFEEGPESTGMAIVFDGDRDSVLAPNAAQLISDFTTVSFWIRVDANTDDPEAYVLDFGHWSERWKISLPKHLKIVWTTNRTTSQIPNAVSDMDAGDGNELVIGFWFYVTMVHDGVDNIIYLDGVEANRVPAEGPMNATGRPFHMGSSFSGKLYFTGALDEVKVYNKALTADEIDKLFTTGTTGIPFINEELNQYVDVLYPNPGSDQIVVKHNFGLDQPLLVRVFDQAGRQIDAIKYAQAELATGQLTWDVNDYDGGYYTLNFVLGGKNLGSIPFVKQ